MTETPIQCASLLSDESAPPLVRVQAVDDDGNDVENSELF